MPSPFKRADRVAGLIQQELSRLLLREVKDPRLQYVIITAVRLSADLRHARVFFTGRNLPEASQAELRGLHSAAGFLRGQLGRSLRLRHAPELSFEMDEAVTRSLHVAALLKQLAVSEHAPDE
jgi:ribosome-binding factor A